MNLKDKLLVLLLIVFFVGVTAFCCIVQAQRAEAEEQAQLQARAAQVESVKSDIQNADFEEAQREATNRQIKAEKAEAARLEAERQEAERLAREQAEQQAEREAAEAEQARQEAERQAQIQQAQQVQAQTQNTPTERNTEAQGATAQGGVLTKEGGVNYYNGSRETWYSSNQLYHYRTSEWTADSEGFYRDSQGRYVVASNNYPNGTEIETSKGTSVVLDKGADGVDFYVNW